MKTATRKGRRFESCPLRQPARAAPGGPRRRSSSGIATSSGRGRPRRGSGPCGPRPRPPTARRSSGVVAPIALEYAPPQFRTPLGGGRPRQRNAQERWPSGRRQPPAKRLMGLNSSEGSNPSLSASPPMGRPPRRGAGGMLHLGRPHASLPGIARGRISRFNCARRKAARPVAARHAFPAGRAARLGTRHDPSPMSCRRGRARRGTEVVITGPTRNRVGGDELSRGFESHPLRQRSEGGDGSGAAERCPSG